MKRRLVRAIVAVTALTILLLGIPLAVVARHWYEDRNTVDLQRRAAEAAVDVFIDPADGSPHVSDDGTDNENFGVYDPTGTLIAGEGPTAADAAVTAALLGAPTFDHATETIVYAIPVTARGDDQVGAVVRVYEPDAEVDAAVHRAWLIMTAVAGAALVIAWLIARTLARRLARPVQQLALAAAQIGAGGVVVAHEPSGVAEFDVLGDTLAASSTRVAEVLARERAFSADVSHQLRTPLTGLRLLLESEPTTVTPRALAEVDRLQERSSTSSHSHGTVSPATKPPTFRRQCSRPANDGARSSPRTTGSCTSTPLPRTSPCALRAQPQGRSSTSSSTTPSSTAQARSS